jgi:hypothetical protein
MCLPQAGLALELVHKPSRTRTALVRVASSFIAVSSFHDEQLRVALEKRKSEHEQDVPPVLSISI